MSEWIVILGVPLALAGLCIWRGNSTAEYRDSYYRKEKYVMATVTLVFVAGIGGMVKGVTEVHARHSSIRRPVLAQAVASASAASNEDILGQVVQFNQMVVGEKYWNTVPIIGLYISEQWRDIEPVDLPK